MTRTYIFKGINDEATVCSVCGKKELSKVVWLAECDCYGVEDGDPFPVGVVCAAKMLSWRNPSSVKTKNKVLLSAITAQAEKIVEEFTGLLANVTVGTPEFLFNEYNQRECYIMVSDVKVQIVSFSYHNGIGEVTWSDEKLCDIAKKKYLSGQLKNKYQGSYKDVNTWGRLKTECAKLSGNNLLM